MNRMRLSRELAASLPQRLRAVAVAGLVAALALLAHAGRLAETPAAAASPLLSRLGPGPLGELRAQQRDSAGQPPRGIERVARRALAAAPLAFEPFFAAAAAGFRGKGTGSTADAALLTEALRRNPRSREARLLLMRHAVGKGDLKGAIDQLAVLNRLTTGTVGGLMTGLGKAIRSEREVDAAVAALAPHPELYEPFVRGFALADKPAPLIVRLIPQLPPAALARPDVRTFAIRLMIQARAFSEARKLWGAGLGGGAGALVHSPDFSDTKAPPPFNWELLANASGAVERGPAGGLSVDYFGRSPGPLVSQLLTLPPGDYTARLDYRTQGGTPGALGLQVRCAGGDAALAERPLDGKPGIDEAAVLRFTVPPQGCAGQTLAVVGRLQEARDPQQASLRRLDLVRASRP